MLNKKEAKEMAKYIALGVSHYDNINNKTDYTLSVLERYNLVEKIKLNDKIMGTSVGLDEEETKYDLEKDMTL